MRANPQAKVRQLDATSAARWNTSALVQCEERLAQGVQASIHQWKCGSAVIEFRVSVQVCISGSAVSVIEFSVSVQVHLWKCC